MPKLRTGSKEDFNLALSIESPAFYRTLIACYCFMHVCCCIHVFVTMSVYCYMHVFEHCYICIFVTCMC